MNKFIAFAFFALCATVAQCQIIPGTIGNLGGLGVPYNNMYTTDLISNNGGASSSSASSASSSSGNNALISQRVSSLPIGPVNTLPIGGYPWVNPWVQQGWPMGTVGPLGPVGTLGGYGPGLVGLI